MAETPQHEMEEEHATTTIDSLEVEGTAPAAEEAKCCYNSPQELLALVSERLVVERTPEEDERLDPLERAFRFLVPLPKRYYWDVVTNQDDAVKLIPRRIRLWHEAVARSCTAADWTHDKIALPVAHFLGLTGSRFHFVTDQMTAADLRESQRYLRERSERDAAAAREKQVSLGDDGRDSTDAV